MTKKLLLGMTMLLTVCLGLTSCSDNDSETTPTASVTAKLSMPIDLKTPQLSQATVTYTNVQTGKTYAISEFVEKDGGYVSGLINLPQGNYNVSVVGTIKYVIDGKEVTSSVKATSNGFVVSANKPSNTLTLNLFTTAGNEGFVISELCFTGTMTPEGKKYLSDQYVKITNNSDEILYADSIIFVESSFTNTRKNDYTPDIIDQAMSVDAIYMIPGTGKSVPVQPGKSLLLALNAKNHKEANTNSYDLSKADFEFFDVSKNKTADENNANVKDLDKWYCYTQSFFVLNTGGNKSYAIAKIRGTKEDFLQKNFYRPYYMNSFVTPAKKMYEDAYMIPNAWVIDAVNLGQTKKYEWNVISSILDKGFTYCAEDTNDATRFGTAVIRKMENGKYVDTNNSTDDFKHKTTPSMK